MNEITLKLTPEQYATILKLLEPSVNLYTELNTQYRNQSKPVHAEKVSDVEEVHNRR